MPSKQSRRYCFTWNNYSDDVQPFIEGFASEHCNYLVYGKEKGKSGTPHLQGFCTLKKQATITALRKLGMTCHLEVAKGTSIEASEYCKKEGDYVEFGTPPTPGKRTDLEHAIQLLKEGQTMHDLAESCPVQVVKYGRGLRELQLLLDKPYDHDDVRGVWYYGAPGTGKSRKARHDNPNAYLKSQNRWWDGYSGQTAVILDDMDCNVLGHYLKIWADRYACTGETKGGTINLRHQKFIVTSNYSIEHLWEDHPEICAAIKRRFKVVHFTEPYKFLEDEKKKEVGDNRMTFDFSI